MKEQITKKPVVFGILGTILIFILFKLAHVPIPSGLDRTYWETPQFIADSALRVVFTVPTIFLLGIIINGNGLKYSFRTKGLMKGLLASTGLILYMLDRILGIAGITKTEINADPLMVWFCITVGIFEECLFRGLLMTAALNKWGGFIRGRVVVTIISGVIFGLFHLCWYLFSNQTVTFFTFKYDIFPACLIGIGLSGMYTYSKNLLSCMFIHSMYDTISLAPGFIVSLFGIVPFHESYAFHVYVSPFVINGLVPLLSLLLCIKAIPFYKVTNKPFC